MKRLFLMVILLAFVPLTGCQETPEGDPDFYKPPATEEQMGETDSTKQQVTAPAL